MEDDRKQSLPSRCARTVQAILVQSWYTATSEASILCKFRDFDILMFCLKFKKLVRHLLIKTQGLSLLWNASRCYSVISLYSVSTISLCHACPSLFCVNDFSRLQSFEPNRYRAFSDSSATSLSKPIFEIILAKPASAFLKSVRLLRRSIWKKACQAPPLLPWEDLLNVALTYVESVYTAFFRCDTVSPLF